MGLERDFHIINFKIYIFRLLVRNLVMWKYINWKKASTIQRKKNFYKN